MPGKQRHRKGKYSYQAGKKEGREQTEQPVRQQAAVPGTELAASEVKQAVSQAPVPSSQESVVVNHPFILSELRSIGIIGVFVFVILIVLALILA